MGSLTIDAGGKVTEVRYTEKEISVTLMDGRTISAPLAWYPRLLHATKRQRKNWLTCGAGYSIHWPHIDEDLSTEGLLRDAPAPLPRAVRTYTSRPAGIEVWSARKGGSNYLARLLERALLAVA